MSERTKGHVYGIVALTGFIICFFAALALFGPFAGFKLIESVDPADNQPFNTAEISMTIMFAIGIAMTAMAAGASIRLAAKGIKKNISDFANPILKSKGKVSFIEISKGLEAKKFKLNNVMLKKYLDEMVEEGFFEDTRIDKGWLVRDVMPCPYCGKPVPSADKKCPNCGATIKK